MANFKEKLKAASIHGCVSLVVMAMVAYLVFFVWYPDEFSSMVSGIQLFSLVVLGEVCLGPLLSFVIYSSKKPKRELLIDYLCVIFVQIAALTYGLKSVFEARPVYVVYVVDRLEVVSASELDKEDLREGERKFNHLPLLGPKMICVNRPASGPEKTALLFSGAEGKDIQLLPKYYRECEDGEISNGMLLYSLLNKIEGFSQDVVEGINRDSLGWLPVVSRFGAWIAIYPNRELDDVRYIDINPFRAKGQIEKANE